MSRFREEHYATKAHKAWVKGKKQSLGAVPVRAGESVPETLQAERRALRIDYFKKKAKRWPKNSKAQVRMF